jgi:hypothetical protein
VRVALAMKKIVNIMVQIAQNTYSGERSTHPRLYD